MKCTTSSTTAIRETSKSSVVLVDAAPISIYWHSIPT